MNEHHIVFPINGMDKIVIELEEPIEEVHCCYWADMVLFHGDKKFIMANDSISECLNELKNIAEKAVRNELQLHESITKDIGFLLNEDLQDKPGLPQLKNKDGSSWWVGYEYCLTDGYKLGTWLYSFSDGHIIFEATPLFPFSYRNYKKDSDYIPYEKWIKGYKPYFVTHASLAMVKSWITQASSLLEQIERNNIRIEKENKKTKK